MAPLQYLSLKSLISYIILQLQFISQFMTASSKGVAHHLPINQSPSMVQSASLFERTQHKPLLQHCSHKKIFYAILVTVLVGGSAFLFFWWYDKQWADVVTKRQVELDHRLQFEYTQMERTVWQQRMARMEAERRAQRQWSGSEEAEKDLISKAKKGFQQPTESTKKSRQHSAPWADQQHEPTYMYNANINKVVDVAYSQEEKGYFPLPIDSLRRNRHNQTIAEILYSSELQQRRIEFQKQRIRYVKWNINSKFSQLYLAKYNILLDRFAERQGNCANEKDWLRLNQSYNLGGVGKELPFCVVVPGFNNNAHFRIEYSLNSILAQNYSNYKVVVIDDCSSDGSQEVYRRYFAFHRVDRRRYVYIENSAHVTALPNIYFAATAHCARDAIVLLVDGDDQLIGRNTLQLFNWGYQHKKVGVLYTNHYGYNQRERDLFIGFASQYSDYQIENKLYRESGLKVSHLRSFWNQLIFQINPSDLRDKNGVYFTITYDVALFMPLLELSCERVYQIPREYYYLYNVETGLNDYNNRQKQIEIQLRVRAMKKYNCYTPFDQRMRNEPQP